MTNEQPSQDQAHPGRINKLLTIPLCILASALGALYYDSHGRVNSLKYRLETAKQTITQLEHPKRERPAERLLWLPYPTLEEETKMPFEQYVQDNIRRGLGSTGEKLTRVDRANKTIEEKLDPASLQADSGYSEYMLVFSKADRIIREYDSSGRLVSMAGLSADGNEVSSVVFIYRPDPRYQGKANNLSSRTLDYVDPSSGDIMNVVWKYEKIGGASVQVSQTMYINNQLHSKCALVYHADSVKDGPEAIVTMFSGDRGGSVTVLDRDGSHCSSYPVLDGHRR